MMRSSAWGDAAVRVSARVWSAFVFAIAFFVFSYNDGRFSIGEGALWIVVSLALAWAAHKGTSRLIRAFSEDR